MIEILTTGVANSVQDLGRFGYLEAGVSRSGAMDGPALETANLLLGNRPEAAGLEIAVFPFRARFDSSTLIAVTGADCPVSLGGRIYPSWWVQEARAGDVLELGLPRFGARAYIGFSGGISVPPVLGSASTDIKSGWGGFGGRGLRRGDRLKLSPGTSVLANLPGGFGLDPAEIRLNASGGDAIRVIAGAEHPVFDPASLSAFEAAPWRVTDEANRQGYRLAGPELKLTRRLELLSHGIMPGTIQVPPSGQPIIQLAEANTCGGYPKIAHVIEADLWRLGQAPVGTELRFTIVNRHEAVEALKRQRRALARVADEAALARRDATRHRRTVGRTAE
ncbi:biotin-dependent carboxyltransferase family protein [Rhizobium cremeum]|uniref:5-oxoprolinase subunit C family protein n=1 Tax=Rhizobium cremeum TaxID=2813827 RepID=UPI001FCFCF12|nr:biotin-dependent carboxyltransferase family protein [Rhizobium cremeum]MCJ7995014.1 biotin-dependent carboxyltransferase family protein [Rhizobium cremeum]MCJ8000674.1 biotin-dependent carboxyltransferase family protein [Rhizobium cremeum]